MTGGHSVQSRQYRPVVINIDRYLKINFWPEHFGRITDDSGIS